MRSFRLRTSSAPSMPAASGTRVALYYLVRECMARYISPILVESVLGRATESRGLRGADRLADDQIAVIVEEAMVGLRLFVSPERLPALMVELAELLEERHP